MHIFEDHFLAEVVDPETGEPVAEGEPGELTITTLTKQAQPVIRYRTGDMTRFLPGPCVCGRPWRRISRIEGRVDDMLIIRGINIYPRQIETLLLEDPSVGPSYAIIVDRRGTMTELIARVELADASSGEGKAQIARRLEARLSEQTRIRVVVDVRDAGTIPRPEIGKAKRVFFQDTDEDPVH
jgi:phenylacetate-CoA ligase